MPVATRCSTSVAGMNREEGELNWGRTELGL